jgi:hypothetical protein
MHGARLALVSSVLAFTMCVACGDDEGSIDFDADIDLDGGPDDDAGDASPIVCEAPAVGAVGGNCVLQSDCDTAPGASDGICLNDQFPPPATKWPAAGYCTRTCSTLAPCPTGSTCLDLSTPTIPNFFACLPDCCEQQTCYGGTLCQETVQGEPLHALACIPGDASGEDGEACSTFADCNEGSICRDDPFVSPGGFCTTVRCTLGSDATTCAGGRCVDPDGVGGDSPLCFPDCEDDTDCRASEGYHCFDGTALGQGKFCTHAEVGDACSDAAGCGVDPWACPGAGDGLPGGYCTIENCPTPGTTSGCPIFSICFDPGPAVNYCAAFCDTGDPTSCRTGYTCAQVPVQAGGTRPACIPD